MKTLIKKILDFLFTNYEGFISEEFLTYFNSLNTFNKDIFIKKLYEIK